MSDERAVAVSDLLKREEWDRGAIEALRRGAVSSVKDRRAIEQAAAPGPETGAGARVKRGIALAVLGRYEEAVEALKDVPPGSPARLVLAQCCRELGRLDETLEILKGLNPDGWSQFDIDMEVVATQVEAGRPDEAATVLSRHSRHAQDRVEYQYRLGTVLEARGEPGAAADAYEAALKLADHPAAAFRLGLIADRYGDEDLALESYQRCLSGASLYVNALLNLGLLYEDREEYDEAEEYYYRVLRIDPNNGRALLYLKDAEAGASMYIDEDLERRTDRRNQVLEMPVTDFELSVRSRNCLRKMGVRSLGDLARCTEAELLSYKNFGETSLKEIKILLTSKGLHLGMGREEHAALAQRAEPAVALADAEVLARPIEELELSVRGRHCLDHLQVHTVGDLIQCTEAELLACRNFGQTSLSEIKTKLADLGLTLKEP